MSVSYNSLVQTEDALVPIRTQRLSGGLWSGHRWADYSVVRGKAGHVVDVALQNGLTFTCTIDQAVLTHGPTNYLWRKVGELTDAHCICLSNGVPGTSTPDGYELLDAYWYGWILCAGWCDKSTDIHFTVTLGRCSGKKKVLLAEGIKAVALVNKWNVQLSHYGSGFDVQISGSAFADMFRVNGAVWGVDQLARIPPGWWLNPTRMRRAMVRGIVESSKPKDGVWCVKQVGPDPLRMQDFLQLFSSVGLTAQQVQSDIYVPMWSASLELGTPTPFPSSKLFVGHPGAPLDHINDFLMACGKTRPVAGPQRMIVELIHAGTPVAPAALRAGWLALEMQQPKPVYDTVRVSGVTTRSDTVETFSVRTTDVKHCISVNGCVLGDDTR